MVDKDKVWDRVLNTTMLIQVQTKRSYIATLSIRQLAIHLSQQGYLASSTRGTCSSCVHWMDGSGVVTSKPSQLLALAQQARNITLYLRSGPKNNTLKNKSLSGQLTQSEQHLLKLNYLKLPDELPSCLLSGSRRHFPILSLSILLRNAQNLSQSTCTIL